MHSDSRKMMWAGRVLSGLMVAFLLMDAVMHLTKIEPVVQAFARLGWPIGMAVPLGLVELVCIALYVYPRSSILGAILLTGYLGGAVVTHLRVGSSLFGEMLFPVYIGILVWGGLYGREPRLRALIPFARATNRREPAMEFDGARAVTQH